MKVLFVHQNFPGQFRSLAPALVELGHEVVALSVNSGVYPDLRGIRLINYPINRGTSVQVHPWLIDFETKVIRAEATFRKCLELKRSGFAPDLIVAHPGWGESLFLKEVWPNSRMVIYCEFNYLAEGADVGFDPEFPVLDDADACRLKLKNINNELHYKIADAGISPTYWQADTFPAAFREKITIIHDGIDTQGIQPNTQARLQLKTSQGEEIRLSRADEVITFVNRNLEPYRGFHVFMRSLPSLLKERPRARVLIVGGSGVSYGTHPNPDRDGAKTWKEVFVNEVRPLISDADWGRVHFLGNLPYGHFISILQISTVHVYLTYPFVLSWSLLEAMSAGCAIVASDTAPVTEVISAGETGRLTNFFDTRSLVKEICLLLENSALRDRLGKNAREHIRNYYDLQLCLKKQIDFLQQVA